METAASDPASISAEREFADWWDKNQETSGIFGSMFSEIEAEFKKARSESRKKYAEAKERIAAIGIYARREYRKIRPPFVTKRFEAARNERRTRTVIAQYDKAAKAYSLIGQNQLKKARRDAARAARGVTNNHSYPLIILSEAELADGDKRNAIRSLRRAIKGPNPALSTYMVLAQLQAENGNLGSAVKTVAAGRKRYGEAAPIMVQNIALLALAKRNTQALALAAECKLSFPEIEQQCQEALKGKFGGAQNAGA
jgi:predicted Zn-dependent protease